MRLIDADSLKRTLCKTKCGSDEKRCVGWPDSCFQSYRMDMLTLTLDEAPTIDAVPVVRCKDCKYSGMYCFGDSIEKILACLTVEEDGFIRAATSVDPDAFCSYGERKEIVNDR